MGYQTITGKKGFTQMTPCFSGVGSDYGIQNVLISGSTVVGEGNESLQVVDSEGNCPESYTWYSAEMMGAAGWYDADFNLSNRVFDKSESFLVNNDAGVYSIQVAGEVIQAGIAAFPCNAGFTSVGNMTPVAKNIQLFAISGSAVMGEGNESLQFVDEEGNCPESYTWYSAEMMGKAGWYDADLNLATREVAPGEGFLLGNDAGEYIVSIPGLK